MQEVDQFSLRHLREERQSLLQQVDSLREDVVAIPDLEMEVLHHADRADALERELAAAEARNQSLTVLAHARQRARTQIEAAARMRYVAASREASAAHSALCQWRAFSAASGQHVGASAVAAWHRDERPASQQVQVAPASAAAVATREPGDELAQLEYDLLLHKRLLRQQATQGRRTAAAQLLRAFWWSMRRWELAGALSRWQRCPHARQQASSTA